MDPPPINLHYLLPRYLFGIPLQEAYEVAEPHYGDSELNGLLAKRSAI